MVPRLRSGWWERSLLGDSNHPLLRVLAEDQAAETNLLGHFVAVMLQTDRSSDACFRFRILPIGDELAVDSQSNPVPGRQNLHLVPVAVVGLLRPAVVAVNQV